VTVLHGAQRVRTLRVAIGARATPTPPGTYAITDKLKGRPFGSSFGCCILALSGHQPKILTGSVDGHPDIGGDLSDSFTLTLPDRKRLELARALATDPKLLLLDEVMAGLRPTETDRLVETLKELNGDGGLTILLIEHVMRAVMALATHVLVMHHGAAIAEGPPGDVVRDRAVIDSYLGAEAII